MKGREEEREGKDEEAIGGEWRAADDGGAWERVN